METISEFVTRNRLQLLRYLDGQVPCFPGEVPPLEFIHGVLSEWMQRFGGKKLQPPTRRERTFWFALYLYEEIQELRGAAGVSDPWIRMQKQNLEIVRELLRSNEALPAEFHATRPGEYVDDDEYLDPDDWIDDLVYPPNIRH